MPLGRPTKYKPEYCDKVVEYMGNGYSKEAFAGEIGVCRDTLYEWASKHAAFSDAIKRGEAANLSYWERIGQQGITGQLEGFNASSWIFTMKNRAGWRDKVEHTGEGGGPIKTESKVLNIVGVPTSGTTET